MDDQASFSFDGDTYDPRYDEERLGAQSLRVFQAMRDRHWRTLGEISNLTGDPEPSISARLRDFRKPRFGGHTVNRQRRGDPADGLFEYQLILHVEYDGVRQLVKPQPLDVTRMKSA